MYNFLDFNILFGNEKLNKEKYLNGVKITPRTVSFDFKFCLFVEN